MTTDNFDVIKNVSESFSISIPSGFTGMAYPYIELLGNISLTNTSPSYTIYPFYPVIGITGAIIIGATGTIGAVGASSEGDTGLSTDCYLRTGGSAFYSAHPHLNIGNAPVNTQGGKFKAWIPFVVNIAQSVVITSATLTVVAYETTTGAVNVRWGCDMRDNAAPVPTSYNSLNLRTMTANFTESSMVDYTAGTAYTYDITTAVQEILNRTASPGWASGNTMAILCTENGSASHKYRSIAAYANDKSYAPPLLTITYG
jgi:hypothetical protein